MAQVDLSPEAKDDPEIKLWTEELASASKREKSWRKEGRKLVAIYEACKKDEVPFNILYSNTETLSPALYNQVPRPRVDRRYKDEDPLGKTAAELATRVLVFLLDNDIDTYTPFDTCMLQAVLEALVPGRGITRFKYDAIMASSENSSGAPDDDKAEPSVEEVTYETVCCEQVSWDRFRHGYAKTWSDVPWICFDHFMDRQELVDNFGEELGNEIPLDVTGSESGDGGDDEENSRKLPDAQGANLAQICEIWVKATREVLFIAPGYKQKILRKVPDPLNLSGFYPCPQPLTLFNKISSLVPVPLYTLYEAQARELNSVTVRLKFLIKALKIRGFYDSTVEGIDKVLQSEDNTLIPVENVAALQQGQSLEKAIFLMPVEKLITVIQQLYMNREQCKQVIYEINGISDILRGASRASETLGAQEIKQAWGTLRLKRMQKVVARYARDCLRIMAEIALSKLDTKTLSAMTGLSFPTAEEKQKAQMILQQLQAQQAQIPPPMPGQPPVPPPPPPDPRMVQAAKSPSWEEIMGLLKDDLQRNYRIDIETNSTVDAEATEDKQDMGELLNAVAQFFSGVTPMVESGVLPFEAAKTMLLAVVRRYKFGPEVEEQLEQMQQPEPKQDPAVAAEAEAAKAEGERKNQEFQQKMQLADAEGKRKQQEFEMSMQMEHQKLENERALAEIELQVARETAQLKRQAARMDLQIKQQNFNLAQKQASLDSHMADEKFQLERESMSMQRQAGQDKMELAKESHKQKQADFKLNREKKRLEKADS